MVVVFRDSGRQMVGCVVYVQECDEKNVTAIDDVCSYASQPVTKIPNERESRGN